MFSENPGLIYKNPIHNAEITNMVNNDAYGVISYDLNIHGINLTNTDFKIMIIFFDVIYDTICDFYKIDFYETDSNRPGVMYNMKIRSLPNPFLEICNNDVINKTIVCDAERDNDIVNVYLNYVK